MPANSRWDLIRRLRVKREKIRSWKEYCEVSTTTNPWGAIYKIAAGKRNTRTQITTLRKSDGTFTADTKETLSLMMDTFAPTGQ